MSQLFGIEATESNKSNEWYTMPAYIEAARQVMGGIDLDPASCEEANRIVKASIHYTQATNGLSRSWSGRVWLNPPYGRDKFNKSSQENWIKALLGHYATGNVSQAVFLGTADTDEKWFQPLWQFPICFADHHVWFLRPRQTREKQMFGTCFVYLGPNEARFTEVFSRFGRIVRAIDTPKPRPIARELWAEEVQS